MKNIHRGTNMKKVALINDLSGFGKCSLTVAIPVISVMGIQPCPLPTAVLTGQTGFEEYYCDDFTDRMDFFTEYWEKMGESFAGIYSGYLASSRQIEKVNHFLEHFRGNDTFYLADPVMGDNGKQYQMFSDELLHGMKKLTLRADVITPNLTELCLLADENYDVLVSHSDSSDYLGRIQSICEELIAKASVPQTVIVTGIITEENNEMSVTNLAVSKEECKSVKTLYTGMSFSGTGDLFASAMFGYLIKGVSIQEAMDKTSYFLQDAIREATIENIPRNQGIPFEKYLSRLL